MAGNKRNPRNRSGNLVPNNTGIPVLDKRDFMLKSQQKRLEELSLKKCPAIDLLAKNVKTGRNIIVIDTNVLIDNFDALNELRKGGNLLVIPLMVICELDKLKNDPRLCHEVRRIIKEIDRLQEINDPGLIVERGVNFLKLNLDYSKPDHQIIACLNFVYLRFCKGEAPYKGFDKVKMITNDFGVKILARGLNNKHKIIVEEYRKGRAKIEKKDLEIPFVYVSKEKVVGDWKKRVTFSVNGSFKLIADGAPIIGYCNKKNAKKGEFAAIRRGDVFEIINPDINCCGIRPKTKKEFNRYNWEQEIALYYTLIPRFDCVFLQGSAGSGKTLIAIAAALEQKRKGLYSKVLIFRVPEPVDRKKTLGLLPGDAGAKIGLYTRPIAQALEKLLIKNPEMEEESFPVDPKKKKKSQEKIQRGIPKNKSSVEIHVDEIFDKNGFEIAVLEYVRGETLDGAFIIVDDAQNLSQHEIKTLITRVGEGSKIVFTGDLAQIDSLYLNGSTSGLAHAIKKMGSDPQVGVVTLVQTLRSRVASLGEKAL